MAKKNKWVKLGIIGVLGAGAFMLLANANPQQEDDVLQEQVFQPYQAGGGIFAPAQDTGVGGEPIVFNLAAPSFDSTQPFAQPPSTQPVGAQSDMLVMDLNAQFRAMGLGEMAKKDAAGNVVYPSASNEMQMAISQAVAKSPTYSDAVASKVGGGIIFSSGSSSGGGMNYTPAPQPKKEEKLYSTPADSPFTNYNPAPSSSPSSSSFTNTTNPSSQYYTPSSSGGGAR